MERWFYSHSRARGFFKKPQGFDQKPYLINLQNDVFDLEHFQWIRHDPTLYLTQIAAAEYASGVDTSKWEAIVKRALACEEDPNDETYDVFHRAMGYTLLGGEP
jgi:phage/plasmid-associated DNA primase